MSLAVEEVREPAALPRFQDAWTTLADRSEEADLFQTYEWVSTWLGSYWPGRRIAFLFFWKGGRLVGLAPFVEDGRGDIWCRRTLASPVDDESFRTAVLAGDEREAVIGALVRHLDQTHPGTPVVFNMAEKTTAVMRALPSAARRFGWRAVAVEQNPSPILRLRGDWEAFLKTKSGHFRSELRRKRKRLESSAAVEEVQVDRADAFAGVFDDILAIERASWKEREGSSFTARPAVARFFREFGALAAERGWLRLRLLYLDGHPAAYVFGVARAARFLSLKTSYDAAFSAASPGSVLFESVVREAFQEGMKTFDFLGVESRWKNEYANDLRPHVTLCLFPKRSLRCWRCLAYENHLRPLVKKRLPWVAAAKRRLAHPGG
jgi:CelD/BcsL family acetyltransferase involved in cellulose biosynthesis